MVSMKTKSSLISEINELVSAVGDKIEADEAGDAERDFIAERCPPRLETVVRSLPTLSMHLLAGIADGPVGLVGLASRSGQLKGTVSKHVQRLVEAGLVERTPTPGNRKEIALSLTPDGEVLSEAHRQLHDEMAAGLRDFLTRYPKSELEVLAKVLRDLMVAEKVGVRITQGQ